MSHEVIAGYNATDEAADGIALARAIADRLGCELVVARVLTSGGNPVVTDRGRQRAIREEVSETRRAIVAALPEESDVEITPVVDSSVARGLHELASVEEAEALVVGSSHHHALGRLLLGGGPETVANGAPCPVFVAPPGFRDGGVLDAERITVAYDGSASAQQALRYATALADRFGTSLRLAGVHGTGVNRPLRQHLDLPQILADGADLVAEWSGGRVAATFEELRGDPHHELAGLTGDGLLVIGSRDHGAVRRVLLGSVSAAVLRTAAGPVAVVPGP